MFAVAERKRGVVVEGIEGRGAIVERGRFT